MKSRRHARAWVIRNEVNYEWCLSSGVNEERLRLMSRRYAHGCCGRAETPREGFIRPPLYDKAMKNGRYEQALFGAEGGIVLEGIA